MPDKILIVNNGNSYGKLVDIFGSVEYNIKDFLRNPKDYKLVMFTGGPDVSPELYGDTSPAGFCHNNIKRDVEEIQVFKMAVKHGILITGICRGLQFINIMNGGKMIHHLDGHQGIWRHDMETNRGDIIQVNSLHHQAILPPKNAVILGWTVPPQSKMYIGKNDNPIRDSEDTLEIEAAIYPKTKSFGVQYHPEMMEPITDGYTWYKIMVRIALRLKWNKFVFEYGGGTESNISAMEA